MAVTRRVQYVSQYTPDTDTFAYSQTLYVAVCYGYAGIVLTMLDTGAELAVRVPFGGNALRVAAIYAIANLRWCFLNAGIEGL